MKEMIKNKHAQMELSYGFLFSVILVGIFIFVAGYAIMMFMDINKQVETGIFTKELQNEIDRIWNGAGEDIFINLTIKSSKITHICFFSSNEGKRGNFENINEIYSDLESMPLNSENNLYFYPLKYADVSARKINHINMEGFKSNPYCIKKTKDIFRIKLSKEIGESLVSVS
jgi:uncharacterized protein (UPF0333 family)